MEERTYVRTLYGRSDGSDVITKPKFRSYASSAMTHAALKWFHSFGLSSGANPLDSYVCHNLLEAARRDKPVTVKRTPISAEIIKTIIDEFAGPSANLKDMRVACICSLGFCGVFSL